jgi:DNA polymerase V
MLARPVPAGFPSPADDYCEERISLDAYLVSRKEATFFMRVEGDSMVGLGIHDGDLLVVDRSLTPVSGSVVIAVVNGEFAVKQLINLGGGIELRSANPSYPAMRVVEGTEFVVWGVVRWAIHRVWTCEDGQ